MILVTGATGNVGRHVVEYLVAEGEPVRAVSRRPEQARFPDPVDVLRADLTEPETLGAALSGVDRAFLFPVPGRIGGFLEAAKEAGVRRVVLLSSSAASSQQRGAIGQFHAENERVVAEGSLPWTFVRPGAFMANDLNWWTPQIKADGVVRAAHGEAAGVPIDERDIAAVATRALLDEAYAGKALELTGPEVLTMRQRVRTLGEVLGRDLRFEELPPQRARQLMIDGGIPPEFAATLLAAFAAQVGANPDVSPTVRDVTGRSPYTYAEWAAYHAADFK